MRTTHRTRSRGFSHASHLKIASNERELGDVESLLAGLPPTKCVDSLTLEIKKARHFEEGALQSSSLGVACANLNSSCAVAVHV
jgi:hypothetical protein